MMQKLILSFLLCYCGTALAAYDNKPMNEKFKAVYGPIYKAAGLTLDIVREPTWEVNARARKPTPEGIAAIEVWDGLLDLPFLNDDLYALILCHETGHHLGGAIKGYEGQADYYAGLKCFRNIFKNDNNEQIVKQLAPKESITEKCTDAWKETQDQLICMRGIVAAEELALKLMAPNARKTGSNIPNDPKMESPDRHKEEFTIARYPTPQCRLDTIIAGLVCNRDSASPLSADRPTENLCDVRNGDRVGVRPACWFNYKIDR